MSRRGKGTGGGGTPTPHSVALAHSGMPQGAKEKTEARDLSSKDVLGLELQASTCAAGVLRTRYRARFALLDGGVYRKATGSLVGEERAAVRRPAVFPQCLFFSVCADMLAELLCARAPPRRSALLALSKARPISREPSVLLGFPFKWCHFLI